MGCGVAVQDFDLGMRLAPAAELLLEHLEPGRRGVLERRGMLAEIMRPVHVESVQPDTASAQIHGNLQRQNSARPLRITWAATFNPG